MAKKAKLAVVSETAAEPETKAAKFKRLGSARVTKARKAISVIGNLSGSGYEYTPEQVQLIRDVLSTELESVLASFNRAGKVKQDLSITL